ncbi:MAG: hypothetical protein SWZ49_03160 [Cyanobacteriota bacterium]|nr:hypothetical protein [Cyanobacteriota bacterium]
MRAKRSNPNPCDDPHPSGEISSSQVRPGNASFEALPRVRMEAEPQAMGSQPETGNQLTQATGSYF